MNFLSAVTAADDAAGVRGDRRTFVGADCSRHAQARHEHTRRASEQFQLASVT